ncbi:FecCD family ABC transporter permease [Natribaculum luteum]|uniref:Cobalamin import system permease protein BtuC n=1 Tax=Natribaculum luteum TaxID=1586232 RepID=A0ABD5NZU7_9EURY|nr:iron ABC transporter permease [Natribaculum luteum]
MQGKSPAQGDGGTSTEGWSVDVSDGNPDDDDLARSKLLDQHQKRHREKLTVITGVIAILVSVWVYATITGPIEISISEFLSVLSGQERGVEYQVVWNIRLPRIVAAVGAGAGLAVAGTVLQSVLRNPLASPYTLGISQGAAFGAAFSIVVLGTGTTSGSGPILSVVDPYLTSVLAFVGALTSTGAIYLVAKYKRATPETLILTGIALASLFTAGTTSLEYFATNTELAALVYWKFGDVSGATWQFNLLLWITVILVTGYFTQRAWAYTVLNAGDETARSLGVPVQRTRLAGMVFASFVTAVVVAMFGIIGFVGLVVPHIIRRVIGGEERTLIPASTVAGGALLLSADTIARTVISPIVLPVGIVTSFVGVPLFLYLILRGREYW